MCCVCTRYSIHVPIPLFPAFIPPAPLCARGRGPLGYAQPTTAIQTDALFCFTTSQPRQVAPQQLPRLHAAEPAMRAHDSRDALEVTHGPDCLDAVICIGEVCSEEEVEPAAVVEARYPLEYRWLVA